MIKPRRHLTAQRVNGSRRNVSSCRCGLKMLKKLPVQVCDARMMQWKTNDRPIKNLYDTLCICALAAPFEFLLLTFELET